MKKDVDKQKKLFKYAECISFHFYFSSVEQRVASQGGRADSDEESIADMDLNKALLHKFTTPIDPSRPMIESTPNSRIPSTSTLHSVNNSYGNIPSLHSSNKNIPFLASSITSVEVTPLPRTKFPRPPESDAGTDLLNTCRICHLPGSDDGDDVLFSPCRCSGSLKYVHDTCLLKWIEISTRKTKKPPKCELCHYLYTRHKRFKFRNWRWPRVSRRDKCLHLTFFITLVVMAACAVATVLCFLSDNGQTPQNKSQLSLEEIVTLTCGVLFFVSFFLAMTVEIKARHTVYRLLQKFVIHNTEWQIEPYDKAKDPNCPKPFLYV